MHRPLIPIVFYESKAESYVEVCMNSLYKFLYVGRDLLFQHLRPDSPDEERLSSHSRSRHHFFEDISVSLVYNQELRYNQHAFLRLLLRLR